MGYELLTAREAYNAGKTRYFTGKPCSNGHVAERMISNGSCVTCLNQKRAEGRSANYERVKVWRLENKDARAIEAKNYREKHPDKVRDTAKRYRANNLESIREKDAAYKRNLRITNPAANLARRKKFEAKKEAKLVADAGRERPTICDICSTKAVGRIVFDHCHAKELFRGWICDRCNKTLGMVKDDCALLEALKLYLENFHDKINGQDQK